jgi:hypothetical protein
MRPLLLRYGFAIGLREWQRCPRVRAEVRVGVAAGMGAVIAPFVVFAAPLLRLYWLLTGRQPPRLFGCLSPQPYVVFVPFAQPQPPEIREVLARPEHQWEPGPGEIPRWYDLWARVGQALFWRPPTGLTGLNPSPRDPMAHSHRLGRFRSDG